MNGQTLLHYNLLDELGKGGQGAVYKAVDTKLGRTVVIKILAPELTAKQANLKRFEREARLASSLDHPNICTIFDLNEANGTHFIAMQYVEGRNVRQLVNGRPLELVSALSIALQVADALTAAHERGIIHRDIKAGNVMVTDTGTVKVLDFGLAKLLDEETARARDVHHTELTEFGVPYGTATYAAPEQARGDADVDARADIFSMGVLLYELLTGTWPFRGQTSIDVRHAVLHDTPQPIVESRTDLCPPRLQMILDRALQKEPRNRYQKMAEFRDDLRRALSESLAIAPATETTGTAAGDAATRSALALESVAASIMPPVAPRHLDGSGFDAYLQRVWRWLQNLFGVESQSTVPRAQAQATRAPSVTETTPLHLTSDGLADVRKSIAILPFRNLNNDADTAFYEFSLSDAVTTELARLRSLVVRPSFLVAKYQGKTDDPRAIGRELNVTAVLAASFLKAGERFRVTAQLLDVASGDMLWSDRVDVAAGDIIGVQDRIAQHIVEGLRIELTPDEQGLFARALTTNPEAYEEYLRGRDCLARYANRTLSHEDFTCAVKHFCRATELDPSFALAHSGIGVCYTRRVIKGFGDCKDYVRAEAEFVQALTTDPQLVEARLHMIYIFLSRGEKTRAREEVERLRREAPNDAATHVIAGTVYRLDGKYDKALRSFERAAQLNPDERVVVSYNQARVLMYEGRYREATDALDAGARLEPNHPLIKTFRARICFYQGDAIEATRILREVLAENPQMDGIRPILAMCLSAQGQHEAARAELTERTIENASADHDIAYWLASAYALETNKDEAFKWLERAIALGNENRAWFERDPNWAQLREDARFKALMNNNGMATPARA